MISFDLSNNFEYIPTKIHSTEKILRAQIVTGLEMIFWIFLNFFAEFDFEAVEWLIEKRHIIGLGTECPDVELSQNGRVKLLLANKGLFSVQQLTSGLKELPMKGFSVIIAPLKLAQGSGGPTRVFAVLNPKNHHNKRKQQHRDQDSIFCAEHDQAKLDLNDQHVALQAMSSSSSLTFVVRSLIISTFCTLLSSYFV